MESKLHQFAQIAYLQSTFRELHTLRISRATLQCVWHLDRWTEPRICDIESSLMTYFRKVKRELYIGRHGELGFDGFTVRCQRRIRAGGNLRAGDLHLLVPDHLKECDSVDDRVWKSKWSKSEDVVAFNLLLLQVSANPWLK